MLASAGAMVMQRAAKALAAIIAPLLLIGLAGCSDAPGGAAADGTPPNPLLYEIASAEGTVEGWMLGTIHALPPDTDWRNPEIGRVIDTADFLVVEIAGLDDGASVARTFEALSAASGLPPLHERVPADLAAPLADLLERGGFEPGHFAGTETWATAITLAQVDATGDPANGVDRALLRDFAGRPVRELEGARAQLAIFDTLPQSAQATMLAAVLRESEAARKDPARLQRAWLAGDAAAIEQSTREGFLADPTLREALLTGRNRRWAAALAASLEQTARPLIAVGTAHLVGKDGLADLLQAQGYRIRRIP